MKEQSPTGVNHHQKEQPTHLQRKLTNEDYPTRLDKQLSYQQRLPTRLEKRVSTNDDLPTTLQRQVSTNDDLPTTLQRQVSTNNSSTQQTANSSMDEESLLFVFLTIIYIIHRDLI